METYSIGELSKKLNISIFDIKNIVEQSGLSYTNFLGLMYKGKQRAKKNHKAVEVKPGPVIDIYTFNIKGTKTAALSEGIFVYFE